MDTHWFNLALTAVAFSLPLAAFFRYDLNKILRELQAARSEIRKLHEELQGLHECINDELQGIRVELQGLHGCVSGELQVLREEVKVLREWVNARSAASHMDDGSFGMYGPN